jgi:hypothetical protein
MTKPKTISVKLQKSLDNYHFARGYNRGYKDAQLHFEKIYKQIIKDIEHKKKQE